MKSKKKYFILFLIAIIFFRSGGAIIKGKITDEKNLPISFVNIYLKGTAIGTNSNDSGKYELKLSDGVHEIIFQCIGFKTKTEKIDLKNDEIKILNLSLEPESYQLKEVKISANAEDPAYSIIRQAMAMRKVYLFECKEYLCTAYMKSLQRLTTVPKKILLIKIPPEIKPGIIYLSESLSEISYQQPRKIKERMISSKVSGSNRAFSFNRASDLDFSLYENHLGFNERALISPIANDAFLYYKFKLEGETKENGRTIYKIKLIPIRDHDPVFRGTIYIVKDSWRIHSTDLLLNKLSGIEFIDTVYIKQQYAQQEGGMWMPVSQRFIFFLDLFGFRGNGYFVALYSKYKVKSMYPENFYKNQSRKIVSDEPVPEIKKVKKVKVAKKTEEDSSLFPKKYFTNEIMSIDKKANQTNDSLWETLRPAPLTEDEKTDYHQKDSIRVIHESKEYMDSMDRRRNKVDWSSVWLTGYTYHKSFKKESYYFTPLSVIQFNTVEGLVIEPQCGYTKYGEDRKNYSIVPNLRYGFASKQLYGKLNLSYRSNPEKETWWRFAAGSGVEQFNKSEPITPLINSIYTLTVEQNFLKEFQKIFCKINFSSEILNGVTLNTSAEYAQRSSLANHSDFTFNDIPARTFISNDPLNKETLLSSSIYPTGFATHNALLFDLNLKFQFAQKYISRPNRKWRFPSEYPVLNLYYSKGINAFGSSVDFDKIIMGTGYSKNFGLFGESEIQLKGGKFLNNSSMYFMDFQHFNANRTIVSSNLSNGFQLLDYYYYSTTNTFAEAHFNHHFNGFIFNKIPLIRKLKLQEVFTFNYLRTSTSPNYFEFGAGIEHIFKLIRIDFFTSFEDNRQMRNGILIGFGF